MSELETKRVVKISTPLELCTIIEQLDEEPGFLVPFMDKADLYLNGCSCSAEEYWEQLMQEYKLLKSFDFKVIKEKLQCDIIRLYNVEEFIAEV